MLKLQVPHEKWDFTSSWKSGILRFWAPLAASRASFSTFAARSCAKANENTWCEALSSFFLEVGGCSGWNRSFYEFICISRFLRNFRNQIEVIRAKLSNVIFICDSSSSGMVSKSNCDRNTPRNKVKLRFHIFLEIRNSMILGTSGASRTPF